MITGYAQGLFFQGTRDQTVCSKRIRTNSLRNIGMYFRTNCAMSYRHIVIRIEMKLFEQMFLSSR